MNVETVIRVTVAARALRQRGGTSDEIARVAWTEKIMVERIQWKRTNGKQLLLDKVYDAVTEEFTRDAMAALATVLAHLCIATNVAKRQLRLSTMPMTTLAIWFRAAVPMIVV